CRHQAPWQEGRPQVSPHILAIEVWFAGPLAGAAISDDADSVIGCWHYSVMQEQRVLVPSGRSKTGLHAVATVADAKVPYDADGDSFLFGPRTPPWAVLRALPEFQALSETAGSCWEMLVIHDPVSLGGRGLVFSFQRRM